ncbi:MULTISPECIES: hypothetical protein [unclassified Pseudomonas]
MSQTVESQVKNKDQDQNQKIAGFASAYKKPAGASSLATRTVAA